MGYRGCARCLGTDFRSEYCTVLHRTVDRDGLRVVGDSAKHQGGLDTWICKLTSRCMSVPEVCRELRYAGEVYFSTQ